MLDAEIRIRVKNAIAKVSGLQTEKIGDHATFDTLEIDSLARIEVLVEIEREFKLNIPDAEEDEAAMSQIQSIDHAVELVQKNLATSAAT